MALSIQFDLICIFCIYSVQFDLYFFVNWQNDRMSNLVTFTMRHTYNQLLNGYAVTPIIIACAKPTKSN